MKKTILAFFMIFIVFTLSYLFYYVSRLGNIPTKSNITKTIHVAWIGPLSGAATILGVDNLKAIQLALSEYNKRKKNTDPTIILQAYDDAYNAKKTNIIFNQLVSKNNDISAVFISDYSFYTQLKKNIKADKLIIIDPIDNDPYLSNINKNIFLIAKRTDEIAAILVEAIVSSNARNVAIFYFNDDNFMPNVAKIISQILVAYGLNFELFPYSGKIINFSDMLKTAKEKKTDAYIFLGYDEIGFAMKQARNLGISSQIYALNTALSKDVQKNAGEIVNGTIITYFTAQDGNVLFATDFLKKFKKKYGAYPNAEWVAMQAYDAANILIDAIVATSAEPTNDSVESIRNYMLHLSKYKGVSGDITIAPNGSSQGIYPGIYTIIQGNAVRKQKE